MFKRALKDEGETRKKNWKLAQNLRAYAQSMVTRKQNRINALSQEKIILQLIVRRKDGQITEHRRTAHRWTIRHYKDESRKHQKQHDITQRLEGAMINNDARKQAQFQDKAAAEIGRIGAGIATGANIIPNGTWDEDWSIAGGEPVDNAPVAPNAGGGFPAVTIAP
ncbi:18862_t:CDS:2, partial [Funneliformis geosporum]